MRYWAGKKWNEILGPMLLTLCFYFRNDIIRMICFIDISALVSFVPIQYGNIHPEQPDDNLIKERFAPLYEKWELRIKGQVYGAHF